MTDLFSLYNLEAGLSKDEFGAYCDISYNLFC
jgi:hypothetical protein